MADEGMIQTVTGPVAPSDLGVTMGHEHVLFDGWDMEHSYDLILDDEALAADELRDYALAGGSAVVECTNVGIGRQPDGLARVAAASGVRIVMGSGWYRRAVHPELIRTSSVEALADVLTAEIERGVGPGRVRPGIIGEIGTERGRIAAAEERVFRAAARAQRRTGIPIWTHTTNQGELALEQIDLLRSEGVAADRIVISHVGDRFAFEPLAAIAATGVYLSIDNIGYEGGGYPADAQRAVNLARLVDLGCVDRILVGGDTCTRSRLRAYGGQGYGRVLREFVPRLRQRGLTADHLERILLVNPARVLTPA